MNTPAKLIDTQEDEKDKKKINLADFSKEELQRLMDEKIDYLKWLIKYSSENHLNLLPDTN
jgi:hypothetical protein